MKKFISFPALVLLTLTAACLSEQPLDDELLGNVEQAAAVCEGEIGIARASKHCVVVFESDGKRSTKLDKVCTRRLKTKFFLTQSKDGCARLVERGPKMKKSIVHGDYCPALCAVTPAVCEDGESQPADDGCNTCQCVNGGWACTKMGCAPQDEKPVDAVCKPGSVQPADDGCNTCHCVNGGWACTKMACPEEEPICQNGEQQPAEDGCNTCTCHKGQWQCTLIYCGDDEDEAVCEEGDTQPAGSKCGDDAVCTCINGDWSCPKEGC